MNIDEDIPVQSSCGKLLSVEEQCDFLSIGRSQLYTFAKDNDSFPASFPHPLAPRRQVRSQAELQAWVDSQYHRIRLNNKG